MCTGGRELGAKPCGTSPCCWDLLCPGQPRVRGDPRGALQHPAPRLMRELRSNFHPCPKGAYKLLSSGFPQHLGTLCSPREAAVKTRAVWARLGPEHAALSPPVRTWGEAAGAVAASPARSHPHRGSRWLQPHGHGKGGFKLPPRAGPVNLPMLPNSGCGGGNSHWVRLAAKLVGKP